MAVDGALANPSREEKLSLFQRLTDWFQGRHTMFVVGALTIGTTLSWFGKLDGNLVTLILGLQGMVLAHSVKESYLDKKDSN